MIELSIELQRHILTTYCDGRSMSTYILLVNKSQKRFLLGAAQVAIVDRLNRVKSITQDHLPAMQSFLDQVIDRVVVNQERGEDHMPTIRDCSTWMALLDYFEFGTIVSPTILNQGSPTAELYQWPVWCGGINYLLHQNAGKGILKEAVLTTPCWHSSLLSCDSLTAATSNMLGPLPAPTGRAYLLQELDLSLDDNTELHNITSNDDRGVIILPVRVVAKGSSWIVPPWEMIIGEKHDLPFAFLQQGNNIEWTAELVDDMCDKIVRLNQQLLSRGFPLLRESERSLVSKQQASGDPTRSSSTFLQSFALGENEINSGWSNRVSMQCSQQ